MPHHSALSYEWGRPDAEAYAGSIYVNQCRMNLKVNLAAALMRLWDVSLGNSSIQMQPRIPPLFWIDAICINQGDVAERSQQVRLMGDIYCNAFSVFAWLGNSTDESQLGMKLLKEYNRVSRDRTIEENVLWIHQCVRDPQYAAN
jgi:hypothetical protein